MDKIFSSEIAKVDTSHGIVFGWGIISKVNGEPYFDLQGDHIPEESMLKAVVEFMGAGRVAGVMHQRDGEAVVKSGDVRFGFPLTTDIANAMGISSEKTGFMLGYKPDDAEVLAKFRSGEFTGFSIGGRRLAEEPA